MARTRACSSGGRLPSGVRLLSVLPSSLAVFSSLLWVQLAMSPAPTSVAVVAVVCPKIGTATTTAATHARTTHAAYRAAWLRISTTLIIVLSMFKGAISLSPSPAHGFRLCCELELSDASYSMLLDECPFPTLLNETVSHLFGCNGCTILPI